MKSGHKITLVNPKGQEIGDIMLPCVPDTGSIIDIQVGECLFAGRYAVLTREFYVSDEDVKVVCSVVKAGAGSKRK